MKLHLDRIEATPKSYTFAASLAWWQEQVLASRLAPDPTPDESGDEPLAFEVEAYRLGEEVFLAGTFTGVLEVECSRCLRRYRHALSESFRLVLEPAGDRQPLDPEGVLALGRDGLCLAEDLELGWYRGEEIDLGAFFSELISLALPIQPLCSEDCRGLCPQCGVDRNQVDCDCEEEMKPPSPFAALAALRIGRNHTEGES